MDQLALLPFALSVALAAQAESSNTCTEQEKE